MEGAVRHLRLNRAGGSSGMKVKHIWAWMRAETWEESPDPYKWDMVVGLIHAYFHEGIL